LRRRPSSRRAPDGVGVADQRKRLAKFHLLAATSMGSVAVMKVVKGFITATMNPSWSH
jgi:hypothetical protein